MFGIGGFELFIILLFAFLIFGPDKLPEMAKTLGVALNKFKQAQEEMKAVINDEVLDPEGCVWFWLEAGTACNPGIVC